MRRPRHDRRASHERWLIPYADLMTLLFAFFTTMYAISTVDAKKLTPAASSLQMAFAGASQGTATPAAIDGREVVPTAAPGILPAQAGGGRPLEPSLDDIQAQLTLQLADAIEQGRVEIVNEPRGLVVSLPESATFATASADVTPAAWQVIARLAAAMRPLGNPIRVEGHTDDVPIHTPRYRSNWELSTARASGVVVYLASEGGLGPERLSAAGYGEYHPRASNDSPEGRARNRRVDIVILGPGPRADGLRGAGGAL